MSSSGDDSGEMTPRPLDDETIDALLAGTAEDHLLESFVADLRFAVSGPVPAPPDLLAAFLAGDISTEPGPAARTVPEHVPAAAPAGTGSPSRKRPTMPIPQFLAGLSLVSKITLGASVAAAATTGAAAGGVLPGPVQEAVEQVVSVTTPFDVRHLEAPKPDAVTPTTLTPPPPLPTVTTPTFLTPPPPLPSATGPTTSLVPVPVPTVTTPTTSFAPTTTTVAS